MKLKSKKYIFASLLLIVVLGIGFFWKLNSNPNYSIGQKIDSLHGVYVFYNGGTGHVSGRNIAADGYNIGLKYQCVEFVKRYYYEHYKHKMPNAYGNAKDYFDVTIKDAEINSKRDLIQYSNPSMSKPQVGDLLIYAPTATNIYGHVSIIAAIENERIEIIQQNPGPFSSSRQNFKVVRVNDKWKIDNERILGWLRKDTATNTIL